MAARFQRGADPRVVELAKEAKQMVDSGKTSCCDLYIKFVRGDIDTHFFRTASMNNQEVEDKIQCDFGVWRLAYTVDRDGDYISEPFRNGLPSVSDVKVRFHKTSAGYVKAEQETGD